MTRNSDIRLDIQGLRAVAVSSVIAFHYGAGWLPGGFTGVDIFFVISGFLITTSILQTEVKEGTFSLLRFYTKRIRRIVPALALVIFATLVAGWFLMMPQDYRGLAESALFASTGLANVYFYLNTGYFDRAAELQPLLHIWSLGVELQFYLVWPLVMIAIMRAFHTKGPRTCFMLAVTVIGFAYASFEVARDESYAFYLLHPRVWELAIGAFVAFLPPIRSDLIRQALALLGLVLVIYSLVAVNSTELFPGPNALYACAGAAILIASGGATTFATRVLALRPLPSVGEISYSLYLWHWPILVLIGNLHHGLLLVITYVLSAATYRFVERPKYSQSSAWVPTAAISISIVAALMITINQGFPSRLPAQQQELAEYAYDNFEDWRITKCFLNPDQAQFASECEEPSAGEDVPKIVLWGDSLAAHIYPGLKAYGASSGMSVMQFTGSLCPPFLKAELIFDRPNCLSTNRQALQAIERQKPAVAFLSGAWFHYLSLFPKGETLASSLAPTVEALKQAGVEKIYLIGPFPGWDEPLPNVLISHLNKFGTIPDRTTYKLTSSILAQDPALRSAASALGVSFLSAIDAMCNDEGCLTKTGPSISTLTAFDIGHLTAEGAAYFVEHISARVSWPGVEKARAD